MTELTKKIVRVKLCHTAFKIFLMYILFYFGIYLSTHTV